MKLKDTIKNESERIKQKVKSTTVNYEKSKNVTTTTWNSRFSMINDISGQFEHDIVGKNGILNGVVFLFDIFACACVYTLYSSQCCMATGVKKTPQYTFDQWVFSRGYIV